MWARPGSKFEPGATGCSMDEWHRNNCFELCPAHASCAVGCTWRVCSYKKLRSICRHHANESDTPWAKLGSGYLWLLIMSTNVKYRRGEQIIPKDSCEDVHSGQEVHLPSVYALPAWACETSASLQLTQCFGQISSKSLHFLKQATALLWLFEYNWIILQDWHLSLTLAGSWPLCHHNHQPARAMVPDTNARQLNLMKSGMCVCVWIWLCMHLCEK